MPRVLGGSYGRGRFLMGEVLLYASTFRSHANLHGQNQVQGLVWYKLDGVAPQNMGSRGGLVCKAHRLRVSLNPRLESDKEEGEENMESTNPS